jgi:capsular polysaccharide biosynthesis protein
LRTLPNREEIEKVLLEHDFEVVGLDDASLEFQLKLFSQARLVVAPTGAALTNMLFCPPGTQIIIFMSNHEISNYYFWPQLGDIAGVDVKIIAGERLYNLTDRYAVHDDYTVDPQAVLEEVQKHGAGSARAGA